VGNYRYAADCTVDVRVTDPKGGWAGADFSMKGYDSSTVSDKVTLCTDFDVKGSYTVAVAVQERDSDYNLKRKYSLNGYFTFTRIAKATSQLTVARAKSGRHSWLIKCRLTRAGRSWPSRTVQLQAYSYGFWYRLAASKRTDKYGRVSSRSTPTSVSANKIRLRLYFAGDSKTLSARSSTFRVTKR
jgi:hypothetical protein